MLKTSEQNWIKVAIGLGAVQGLTWFILSLICIVYNLKAFEVFPTGDISYTTALGHSMYQYFLKRSEELQTMFSDSVVNPTCFTIFCWIYMLSSVAWVFISAKISLIGNDWIIPKWLKYWSYTTFFISAVDLLFTTLLGVEYNKCIDNYLQIVTLPLVADQACTNLVIPVAVISARGFTLWIVNVVIASVIFILSRNIEMRSKYNASRSIQPLTNLPINFRTKDGSGLMFPPETPRTPQFSPVAPSSGDPTANYFNYSRQGSHLGLSQQSKLNQRPLFPQYN